MESQIVNQPQAPHKVNVILLGIIGILTIIVLGLSANAVASYHYSAFATAAPVWAILSCLYTFAVVGYVLVTTFAIPAAFRKVVLLAMLAFGILLWLISWTTFAGWAVTYDAARVVADLGDIYDGYGYSGFDLGSVPGVDKGLTAWRCGAAAAGLGALIDVLFIASFIFALLRFFNDRKGQNIQAPYSGQPGVPMMVQQPPKA